MSITLLLHINNEDPILCEVDHMPTLTDVVIIGRNPRRRDGKDIPNIQPNVTTVIWPINRLVFVEIMPTDEEEKVISFVRE
ncbi:MAG TPA: hypothetical protein VJL59_01100 [Anaerolineales bacterium]|nr:hypothetical protein [Anaerolineales bacterium]